MKSFSFTLPWARSAADDSPKESPEHFAFENDPRVHIPLGMSPTGERVYWNTLESQSLAVAGRTGRGKTSLIGTIIAHLQSTPQASFANLCYPHRELDWVATDAGDLHITSAATAQAFHDVLAEKLEERSNALKASGLQSYLELPQAKALFIVSTFSDWEGDPTLNSILRLISRSPSLGVHLIAESFSLAHGSARLLGQRPALVHVGPPRPSGKSLTMDPDFLKQPQAAWVQDLWGAKHFFADSIRPRAAAGASV